MVEGRRITTPAMRDLVMMVYGGLLNKQIVAQLGARGCSAVGLTGADGQVLEAKRRPPSPIDYGCVGDIVSVRTELLESLLAEGHVPVVAPLSWESSGEVLNSNADGVACALTEAFASRYETYLLYGFDQPGVLIEVGKPDSLLPKLNQEEFLELKAKGRVHGGMLPKLASCFRAKSLGAREVFLASPDETLSFMEGRPSRGTFIV